MNIPAICRPPCTSPRSCSHRGLYRHPLCRSRATAIFPRRSADGNVDFPVVYARSIAAIDAGGTNYTLVAGVHVGCFDLFAQGHPQHRRPQGQERRPRVASPLGVADGGPCRARPGAGYSLGHQPLGRTVEAVCGRQGRRLLGLPPVPQDLRARHIGHVIVNTPSTDRGRSISAACWPATATSSASIRSRPSA